jgi:hypothetical protein
VNGVLRDGTAGDAKNGILHDDALVLLQECFREVDLMPASAFIVLEEALVLDECFVAVFFRFRASGDEQMAKDSVVVLRSAQS